MPPKWREEGTGENLGENSPGQAHPPEMDKTETYFVSQERTHI